MPCYSPLKGFQNLSTGGITFRRSSLSGFPMEVACGQCLGCRLDRSQMWMARIVHEAGQWLENSFVTLTYRELSDTTRKQRALGHYVPGDGSLNKEHFKKFMKRLRKRFSDRKIKYYHCGEYGDDNGRPHYHACLFNVGFDDQELYREQDGVTLFISKTLEQLWPYGFSTIGEVTPESAAYVSRYCLKKVTGVLAEHHYLRFDDYGVAYWLQPEYATMSLGREKGNGIGAGWFEEYRNDFFPSDECPVPGRGIMHKIPRYYETLLERVDPELLESIKSKRRAFRAANAEDYTPERLMQKYRVKKRQLAELRREL